MPLSPKDIADHAVTEWLMTGYGWIVTAAIVIAGLIWRTSKEHSRYEAVLIAIEKMQKTQENCITQDSHDAMQDRCQEHIMHLVDAKLFIYERSSKKEMQDLREDMHNLNANICKLMGAQGIEPITTGKRRRDDP